MKPVPRQATRRLVATARARRSNPTPAEQLVWEALRDRRLGAFRFRRSCIVLGRLVAFWAPGAGIALEVGDGEQTELLFVDRGVSFYRLAAVSPETLSTALEPIRRELGTRPFPRVRRPQVRVPQQADGHLGTTGLSMPGVPAPGTRCGASPDEADRP